MLSASSVFVSLSCLYLGRVAPGATAGSYSERSIPRARRRKLRFESAASKDKAIKGTDMGIMHRGWRPPSANPPWSLEDMGVDPFPVCVLAG